MAQLVLFARAQKPFDHISQKVFHLGCKAAVFSAQFPDRPLADGRIAQKVLAAPVRDNFLHGFVHRSKPIRFIAGLVCLVGVNPILRLGIFLEAVKPALAHPFLAGFGILNEFAQILVEFAALGNMSDLVSKVCAHGLAAGKIGIQVNITVAVLFAIKRCILYPENIPVSLRFGDFFYNLSGSLCAIILGLLHKKKVFIVLGIQNLARHKFSSIRMVLRNTIHTALLVCLVNDIPGLFASHSIGRRVFVLCIAIQTGSIRLIKSSGKRRLARLIAAAVQRFRFITNPTFSHGFHCAVSFFIVGMDAGHFADFPANIFAVPRIITDFCVFLLLLLHHGIDFTNIIAGFSEIISLQTLDKLPHFLVVCGQSRFIHTKSSSQGSTILRILLCSLRAYI